MRLNKLLVVILLLIPFVQLVGCGGGGGGGPAVPPVLVSITITPANTTVATNSMLQYTATGTYSNNAVLDLTASATWTSSAPSVVTVSDSSGSKGAANAVAAGTAVISAAVGAISGSTNVTVTAGGGSVGTGANVMTLSVNGSLCSAATSIGYFNKPCVSVTICNPGPGNQTCQTVNDILLDTGSVGLRIFRQAIPGLTLSQVAAGSGSLTGCVQFADQSSLWGPIMRANVQLGNEPATTIPIQVIDASFGTASQGCGNADVTPANAGFTGIMGVGLFQQDCGLFCANTAANARYFSCTGANCVPTQAPIANQVANPVAALPQDNNGVIVQLPFVPAGGIASTTGSLVLGIGTQTNNAPGSATVLRTNNIGEFTTVFNGVTHNDSFLDTGSNADFIPNDFPTILPPCSSSSDWYCPPVTRFLFASTVGFGGTPIKPVAFTVSNADSLFASGNRVFSDIAGPSTFGFDWGMPFHLLGRNVIYGFEGKATPALGVTGPYVAY